MSLKFEVNRDFKSAQMRSPSEGRNRERWACAGAIVVLIESMARRIRVSRLDAAGRVFRKLSNARIAVARQSASWRTAYRILKTRIRKNARGTVTLKSS